MKYREQVGLWAGKITIPHFDKVTRVNINDIFVPPNFIKPGGEKEQKLSLDAFMIQLYRSVVLGDPGGGKSTLSQKICYELSMNYNKRSVSGRLLTPVLMVLRDYGSRKKKIAIRTI